MKLFKYTLFAISLLISSSHSLAQPKVPDEVLNAFTQFKKVIITAKKDSIIKYIVFPLREEETSSEYPAEIKDISLIDYKRGKIKILDDCSLHTLRSKKTISLEKCSDDDYRNNNFNKMEDYYKFYGCTDNPNVIFYLIYNKQIRTLKLVLIENAYISVM